MSKAIGMVECTTVSTGFKAADDMAKAADVELLQAEATSRERSRQCGLPWNGRRHLTGIR